MKNIIKPVVRFAKKHSSLLIMGGLAIATVGSISYGYNHQSNQALARQRSTADLALKSKIDEAVVVKATRKKVAYEQKVAAEQAAADKAAADKAAAEQAAAAEAAKKKTTTQTTEEKKKTEQKTYETVGVSLSRSGNTLTASIGTAKSGTCYFAFKRYEGDVKTNYAEASSSAAGGTCSATMPDGVVWTKAYVTYKAGDYSAKGYADIAL